MHTHNCDNNISDVSLITITTYLNKNKNLF